MFWHSYMAYLNVFTWISLQTFFYLMHPSNLQWGRILLSFFVIMILVFGLTHCQFLPAKPTEPVPYTNENRGHCECGNISQGFHTYTFWIGEMQRCFTVNHPVSREKEKLPVFFLVKFLCSGSTGKTRIWWWKFLNKQGNSRFRVWVGKRWLQGSTEIWVRLNLHHI